MGILDLSDPGSSSWYVRHSSTAVEIVLSRREILAAELGQSEHGGFVFDLTTLEADADIPAEITKRAQLLVVEVCPDNLTSLRRIEKIREQYPRLALVAAVRDASISVMRTLLRAGVSDVLSLPLVRSELDTIVARLRDNLSADSATPTGKIVSVIKSVGGVGATALLTQLATLYAEREIERGRQTALFDLDLQCGNAATYLGVSSSLTVADVLDAGARLDAAVLRSVAVPHRKSLSVFAAPTDMMPLESVETDQVCALVDLARTEYGTVFIDLPSDWTNWSLSVVARSQAVLLVVDLTVASLRQARRQIELLDQIGVAQDTLQVIVNRVEKKLFKQIDTRDAENVLGRPVAYSVSNDFPLMMAALNQGIPVCDIKAKSGIRRDLEKVLDGIDLAFERG